MMLTTTKRLLREHGACKDRYRVLLEHIGQRYHDDQPITLLTVLASNGFFDTLWCLRAVPPEQEAERDRLAREVACDFAEHVLPIYEAAYPNDKRPRQAIETARKYLQGLATEAELANARRDAIAAANVTASLAAIAAANVTASAANAAIITATAAAEREWQTERLRERLAA